MPRSLRYKTSACAFKQIQTSVLCSVALVFRKHAVCSYLVRAIILVGSKILKKQSSLGARASPAIRLAIGTAIFMTTKKGLCQYIW